MKFLIKIVISLSLVYGLSFATPFNIDASHSEVGFSVKHLMISNVKGKFNFFDAKIDFNPTTMEFNSLSSIVDTDSINTENERRDQHLKSADFFEAEKYPEIKFVMTSYEKEDKENGKMKGNLTIKGVTKPVVLDVEIGGVVKGFKGETRLGFTLSGKIDRKEFGLVWNKTLESGGVIVGDTVKMVVEIESVVKK